MIFYRTATFQDNGPLLELTRSVGMSGTIAIRTDRDPDFFGLMALRGPSTVFVAVDGKQIVGSICVSREEVYERGVRSLLYYISDFKVHPEYRKRGIGLQLTCQVVDFLEENQADLALLHVAHGNKRPFVFFRNREHYPDFENIGTFRVIQFLGTGKKIRGVSGIRELNPNADVLGFLNDFYRTRQLARVVTAEDLENVKIFAWGDPKEPQAILCLQDTEAYKRHVVLKLPLVIRGMVSFLNLIRPITRSTRLPRIGEPMRMLYIKYLAAPIPDRRMIRALIQQARQEAHKGSYAFVSLGLHERDPLIRYLPGLYRIVFNSTGMLVSMKRNTEVMSRVHTGIPFKDFSTI